MEQHPVPQQISSYEFRLVGDMTLRQFGQVAAGCIIALVFYASGLPGYFKWPLVIFFLLLGTAMAFLPFEERPLQTWIIAFFKAVYSPTQYLWQKKPQKPEFLQTKPFQAPKVAPTQVFGGDQRKLTEYLQTLPNQKNPLDQKEEGFLNQVTNLFSVSPLPQNVQVQVKPLGEAEEPAGLRIRRLGESPVSPTPPQVHPWPQQRPMSEIPNDQRPPWHRLGRPPGSKNAKPAEFSQEIPIPTAPSIPNLLVGMIKDASGKMVEGAIMEIRDAAGNPVRAFRTNKLGQFRIATPLPDGNYEIEIEKEGQNFDLIKLTLTGEIVQPIEITAKGGTNLPINQSTN